jgi:hypothetical protein
MPNSVLTPQTAAKPNAAMKTTPVIREENELLLQAWSTAMAQTTNKKMAAAPTVFSSMITSSC